MPPTSRGTSRSRADDEGHGDLVGQAGDREPAGQRSATSAARAARTDGIVTLGDRLDDEPADRPHLVAAEPAGGRGRRPEPDPRRRVRWMRSNGIPFLLTVIPISSSRCSASLPVTPSGVTSTSMRWLSVPPETSRAPRAATRLGQDRAFSTVRRWSRRKSSLGRELERPRPCPRSRASAVRPGRPGRPTCRSARRAIA